MIIDNYIGEIIKLKTKNQNSGPFAQQSWVRIGMVKYKKQRQLGAKSVGVDNRRPLSVFLCFLVIAPHTQLQYIYNLWSRIYIF